MGMNTHGLAFENRPSEIVVTPPRPPLESGRSALEDSRSRAGQRRDAGATARASKIALAPSSPRLHQAQSLHAPPSHHANFPRGLGPVRGVFSPSSFLGGNSQRQKTRRGGSGGWKRGERLTVFGGEAQEGPYLPQGCVLWRGACATVPPEPRALNGGALEASITKRPIGNN